MNANWDHLGGTKGFLGITFGGRPSFAAFTGMAYATNSFPVSYSAFMTFAFCLDLRASPLNSEAKGLRRPWRRRAWDFGFSASASMLAMFTCSAGNAVGNGLMGIALESVASHHGNIADLLNPYAVMGRTDRRLHVAMNGAITGFLKIRRVSSGSSWRTLDLAHLGICSCVFYVPAGMYTLVAIPRANCPIS